MKVVITGAHFTPAQAVIEQLRLNGDIDIVYIGRLYTREGDSSLSVESQVLPKLGIKFIPITSGRLQRVFTRYTIPSLLKIPVGAFQSFYYLLKEKPDVVLSFGGYIAVPVVFAAWLLSIPVIIHEQTLVSGLATQVTGLFADKIAISFNVSDKTLPEKYVLTGNPLRQDILSAFSSFKDMQSNGYLQKVTPEYQKIIHLSKQQKLPLILITAGNQGSHLINQTVLQALDDLNDHYCIIHQAGDSKYQDYDSLNIKKTRLKNKDRYLVKKWIDVSDLGYVLSNTDLAVTRAGINTLLELAYFKVPSLIIPLPYVAKDEQTINAQYFQKKGIAVVLKQENLTPSVLAEKLSELSKSTKIFKQSTSKTQNLVYPDAARRLASEVINLSVLSKKD